MQFRGEALISGNGWRTWCRRAVAVALFVGLSVAVSLPLAADQSVAVLTPEGTKLGSLATSGSVSDLRFVVDLQGDVPEGTYVWVNLSSNKRRQRTNEGYWVDWSGNLDDLIDNRFPIGNGKVVFKIMDEDLGADNSGLTLNIGYKVGNVWKFGVFPVLPSTTAP